MTADLPEFFDPGELVAVLTTQPLGGTLDYKAPEGGCHLGAFVEVPLGPRKGAGGGLGPRRRRFRPQEGAVDHTGAGRGTRCADEMQEFLRRAADYTLTPMPAMLRLATRAPGLSNPPSMQKVYRLGPGAPGPRNRGPPPCD